MGIKYTELEIGSYVECDDLGTETRMGVRRIALITGKYLGEDGIPYLQIKWNPTRSDRAPNHTDQLADTWDRSRAKTAERLSPEEANRRWLELLSDESDAVTEVEADLTQLEDQAVMQTALLTDILKTLQELVALQRRQVAPTVSNGHSDELHVPSTT